MCVTNTTSRRPVTLGVQAVTSQPLIASRLSSSLFSLESAITSSTSSTVPVRSEIKPDAVVSNNDEDIDDKNLRRRAERKRKRKPQKPGMTAKHNHRHFVVHSYHDHANDPDETEMFKVSSKSRRRGGVSIAFPLKLHMMLEQIDRDGFSDVISWQPHGRCFVIHDPKAFVSDIMPKYFKQTKITSFQRQLNLYGFQRLTKGVDNGGYYHELFLRGRPFLTKNMQRIKVKGTGFKAASSPDDEPDFYAMPTVVVTPNHTSDDGHSEDEDSLHSESTMTAPMPAQQSQLYYTGAPLERPRFPMEQPSQPSLADMEPLPVSFPMAAAPDPVASFSDQQMLQESILDDVVDELFMREPADSDNITDLVQNWDPDTFLLNGDNAWFANSIDDDAELGRLLEKVLED